MRKRRIGAAKIKSVAGSMTAGMKTHAPSVSFAKTYAMMAKTMERTWMFDPLRTVTPLRFLTILSMPLTMLVKQIKQESPKKTNPTVDILTPSPDFPLYRHPGLDPGPRRVFLSQHFSWLPALSRNDGEDCAGFQVPCKIKTNKETESVAIIPIPKHETRNRLNSIGISDRCQSVRITKETMTESGFPAGPRRYCPERRTRNPEP